MLLAVFIGGGLGSYLRYCADKVLKKTRFLLLSTFTINTLGSLALGLVTALTVSGSPTSYFLATGFCGGFTTFSTAMVELVKAVRSRSYALLISLGVFQFLAAYGALWLGVRLGEIIH